MYNLCMATPVTQLSTTEPKKRGGPRPGAGRPDKSRLVGSINEYFRPYTKLYEGTPAFMIAAEAARGQSHVRRVSQYIARQNQHHQKTSFRDEFIQFLISNQIEFDERYSNRKGRRPLRRLTELIWRVPGVRWHGRSARALCHRPLRGLEFVAS